MVTRWLVQEKNLSWYINEPIQNFRPPKTEFAWWEVRKMLGRNVSERKLHENMLGTCSLMYIQLLFIACSIKKCFWLQFNRSEPCWSSGCIRNRQGSGIKYRLSRCKHCIKMFGTTPAHSWPIKFKQHRSLKSLNISKQHLAPVKED